jgi:D-alanine-D-alanine ligase
MKLLVLGGGNGSEREVSLRSSAAVAQALTKLGHDVRVADPKDGAAAIRQAARDCDMVFPVLHGQGGEDGTVQQLLEDIGKPYLGSDVAASQLCFDKAALKAVLVAHGILTPRSQVVTAQTFAQSKLTGAAFVLKPIADGSSVGTMIVRELPYDRQRSSDLLAAYGTMLLEELIVGDEITVPVLGDTALPVIEIVPPSGKDFDYENKYNGATAELCPPRNVSARLQEQAQRLAEQVHSLSGARHLSRTDMMIDAAGRIYVLEINTMPGMTTQSLLPKSAAAAGLPWTALVAKFVEMVHD